ncbi:MAG: MCP four helix bundle domain-containing protein [Deltaproteobacteria bacterium]|nr:MCP four helix bundle domain-containing protein [Deltaproteobacteria bacterium]
MLKKISLRSRILLNIIALLIITIMGALVMVEYTYRMEGLLTQIIDKYMAGLQTAQSLENALVNQKGFASYYLLDGNPNWLKQMAEYRHLFEDKLEKTQGLATTVEEKKVLDLIESEYAKYITTKDQVVEYYKSGDREKGIKLHEKVRESFFEILKLCENGKQLFSDQAQKARTKSLNQAKKLRIIAGSAVLMILFLGVVLTFFLLHDILDPIRRLALETDRHKGTQKSGDEVTALSRSVYDLRKEYDQTQVELEKSREHLLQSEKLALVGKLAAGTSHSIRNPLTSVKMRLFSLSRSLDLDGDQKEDFDVISEEIGHIDTIVQNFLEFSRPPRLKLQPISPSDVVDQSIQLLQHRLESYEVFIKIQRKELLPLVQVDPEQLKEVLVNIIVNACEAMGQGGSIIIYEETVNDQEKFRTAVIRISDNGPGISDAIQSKIMEPFFTTKEEGTGLGLSITTRIVQEHGGRLDVSSKEGKGSTFIITLPIKGSNHDDHSDH